MKPIITTSYLHIYKAKQNQLNPRRGNIPQYVNHGYSEHRRQMSTVCVVMYSKSNLDEEIQMSYRAMEENISSSI